MIDPRELMLELLKEPTERDLQSKVGASNFSQPCARCLADSLLHNDEEEPDRPYWAGSVIGTAIHLLLEERVRELHPDWLTEQRVVFGDVPEYGTVKSTTDLYIPEHYQVHDHKTTTKAKLPNIKEAFTTEPTQYDTSTMISARNKVTGYRYQGQAYGLALTRMGYRVDWVSLGFVCRDAVGDNDIWGWVEPYDSDVAERVWDRLVQLWEWLQKGNDPVTLPSASGCYTCERARR